MKEIAKMKRWPSICEREATGRSSDDQRRIFESIKSWVYVCVGWPKSIVGPAVVLHNRQFLNAQSEERSRDDLEAVIGAREQKSITGH